MTTMDVEEMRRLRQQRMDRERKRRHYLAKLQGVPTSLVPAQPVRRRLLDLTGLGWSSEAIVAMYGQGTAAGLCLIMAGRHRNVERRFAGLADLPLTYAVPDTVPDNCWVPTEGAARRVKALLRLGWRHQDIEELVGRSTHAFAMGSHARTRAIDWRRIAAAFEILSATPGPSKRTRLRAEGAGYFPPLAWDDIDDPAEHPERRVVAVEADALDERVVERILAGERLPASRAERAEVVLRWLDSGRSMRQLETQTGWNGTREKERAYPTSDTTEAA